MIRIDAKRTAAFVTMFLVLGLATTAAGSNAHGVVYNFTGGNDGGDPATGLVFNHSGFGFGTTVTGGQYGCGTLFKLTPAQHGIWTETPLWQFTCGADGKNPHGGVTFDTAGNAYGTTVAGGNGGSCTGDGCGVVFKFTTRGVMRVLHSFTGGNDGYGPGNPVALDASGNVYGMTPDGGAFASGVVYELSPDNQHYRFKVLHAFTAGADGATGSLGPLLIDSAGNLFGVTEIDGRYGAGTAFEIVRSGSSWTFKTIHQFKGMPGAGSPYGGLISDAQGNLYGTSYFGGTYGQGAVFELHKTSGGGYRETGLYSFQGGASDGSLPTSTLLADSQGNLFGTTTAGGPSCDCGVVFELAAGTHAESVLHFFGSSLEDGQSPLYGLTPGPFGAIYTSTVYGGSASQGTIFGLGP